MTSPSPSPSPYTAATWPTQFATGVIIGTVVSVNGAPMAGKTITFTPEAPVLAATNNATLVFAEAITVALDANGSFAVVLPATDSPNVQPSHWTYQAVENWTNGRTYSVAVPAGKTTNLLDVSPLQPSAGLLRLVGPKGDPGPPGPPGTLDTVTLGLIIDGGTPTNSLVDTYDGGTP